MIDHQKFQDDLKAYCDHELPVLRRLAVQRHLSTCAACREEITFMQQLADDLRTEEAKAEPLDADLRAKILTSLDENKPSLPVAKPKSRRRTTLVWGGAAAALVVAGLAIQTSQIPHASYAPQDENQTKSIPASSLAIMSMRRIFHRDNTASVPAPTVKVKGLTHGIRRNGQALYNSTDGNGAVQFSTDVPNDASRTPLAVRRIHKEANLGIEVTDPEATGDQITDMVKSAGGFMSNTTLSTGDDELKTSELTLQIPVAQFEPILAKIAKLGKVMSKNVTGQDITEDLSDADQAENIMEDEVARSDAQLKKMGPRAKWRDQEAARDLRIQLAQSRARLELLKKMGRLSTLTVDLTQKAKPEPPVQKGLLTDLKSSGGNALQSVVGAVGGLLSLLIWIVAYAPIWVPLAFGIRWAVRGYQKRAAPEVN